MTARPRPSPRAVARRSTCRSIPPPGRGCRRPEPSRAPADGEGWHPCHPRSSPVRPSASRRPAGLVIVPSTTTFWPAWARATRDGHHVRRRARLTRRRGRAGGDGDADGAATDLEVVAIPDPDPVPIETTVRRRTLAADAGDDDGRACEGRSGHRPAAAKATTRPRPDASSSDDRRRTALGRVDVDRRRRTRDEAAPRSPHRARRARRPGAAAASPNRRPRADRRHRDGPRARRSGHRQAPLDDDLACRGQLEVLAAAVEADEDGGRRVLDGERPVIDDAPWLDRHGASDAHPRSCRAGACDGDVDDVRAAATRSETATFSGSRYAGRRRRRGRRARCR